MLYQKTLFKDLNYNDVLTSDKLLKLLNKTNINTCLHQANKENLNQSKKTSWETLANFEAKLLFENESDDSEGWAMKFIIPSNITDIYTRIGVPLGVKPNGHVGTPT